MIQTGKEEAGGRCVKLNLAQLSSTQGWVYSCDFPITLSLHRLSSISPLSSPFHSLQHRALIRQIAYRCPSLPLTSRNSAVQPHPRFHREQYSGALAFQSVQLFHLITVLHAQTDFFQSFDFCVNMSQSVFYVCLSSTPISLLI